MGLYLCVFDEAGEEIDGVEVGSYADWGAFIEAVVGLEGSRRGCRFPLLTLQPDSDGAWSSLEAAELVRNLDEIGAAFRSMAPVPPRPETWQGTVAKGLGLRFETLHDCFIDVDGESLIHRLQALAEVAFRIRRPVLFQ